MTHPFAGTRYRRAPRSRPNEMQGRMTAFAGDAGAAQRVDNFARRVLDRAMSEAEWQRQVTEFAETQGWLWYHVHDSRKDNAGFPDLVMVRPPRLVFAELKKEGKHPSYEQEVWLGAVRASGAEAYLWRPSSWPNVKRILAKETR